MVWKKTESKNSWTLFFFSPFPPHVWDSVFFRAPKLASALDYPSATFQHQGSGYSFRGAKGSLYWFCPIQIPSKCWGWSNLGNIYIFTLNTRLHQLSSDHKQVFYIVFSSVLDDVPRDQLLHDFIGPAVNCLDPRVRIRLGYSGLLKDEVK